ncbi:hypothetical protein NC652_000053 [Populus alba x Populus x berolinensis]|nr:hypothetical protein NC652_000053 [Populus alba x Populus x berolinensis]
MDFRVLVAKVKDFVMGEKEPKKAESEGASLPTQAQEHGPVKEEKEVPLNDSANEKSSVLVTEKVADPPATAKNSRGSNDRDAVLARVEAEKRCALVKAWEENEKAKAENNFQFLIDDDLQSLFLSKFIHAEFSNRAHKKLSAIGSWETIKRESVEAKIKKYEVGKSGKEEG